MLNQIKIQKTTFLRNANGDILQTTGQKGFRALVVKTVRVIMSCVSKYCSGIDFLKYNTLHKV